MTVLSTLVEGEWITAFIVAVIGAVGSALIAYQRGRSSQPMTLQQPVPIVPTSKVFTPPTWDQFQGHHKRIESLEHTVSEMRRDQAIQFREFLQALSGQELRLGEKVDGLATTVHTRVDQVLKNCAFHMASQSSKRS